MHITANVISFFIYVNHCWKKASSGSIAVEPLTAYYEIKASARQIKIILNELKRTILVLLESKGILVDIQL